MFKQNRCSLRLKLYKQGMIASGLVMMIAHSGISGAHHGTAVNYDWDQTVLLNGVVTEFIWRNPHAALFLDVTEQDGTVVNYAIELTSPVMMARSTCGWTRNTFKPGDDVQFPVHPSRTNQPVVAGLGQCEEVIVNGVSTKK